MDIMLTIQDATQSGCHTRSGQGGLSLECLSRLNVQARRSLLPSSGQGPGLSGAGQSRGPPLVSCPDSADYGNPRLLLGRM